MIDTINMFKALIKNPRNVGTIVPSSRYLGRKIASKIKNRGGIIVEFGGGTGSVSRSLLDAGVSPENLYIFELDSNLASILKKKFPRCNVISDYAESIINLDIEVDCIVSCLPLKVLSKKTVEKTVQNSKIKLKDGGQFIQFTYDLKRANPILSSEMSLKNTSFVPLNIPPARVDVFS